MMCDGNIVLAREQPGPLLSTLLSPRDNKQKKIHLAAWLTHQKQQLEAEFDVTAMDGC